MEEREKKIKKITKYKNSIIIKNLGSSKALKQIRSALWGKGANESSDDEAAESRNKRRRYEERGTDENEDLSYNENQNRSFQSSKYSSNNSYYYNNRDRDVSPKRIAHHSPSPEGSPRDHSRDRYHQVSNSYRNKDRDRDYKKEKYLDKRGRDRELEYKGYNKKAKTRKRSSSEEDHKDSERLYDKTKYTDRDHNALRRTAEKEWRFGDWKEMISKNNGKKYYYNERDKSSQWEKPEEWSEYELSKEYASQRGYREKERDSRGGGNKGRDDRYNRNRSYKEADDRYGGNKQHSRCREQPKQGSTESAQFLFGSNKSSSVALPKPSEIKFSFGVQPATDNNSKKAEDEVDKPKQTFAFGVTPASTSSEPTPSFSSFTFKTPTSNASTVSDSFTVKSPRTDEIKQNDASPPKPSMFSFGGFSFGSFGMTKKDETVTTTSSTSAFNNSSNGSSAFASNTTNTKGGFAFGSNEIKPAAQSNGVFSFSSTANPVFGSSQENSSTSSISQQTPTTKAPVFGDAVKSTSKEQASTSSGHHKRHEDNADMDIKNIDNCNTKFNRESGRMKIYPKIMLRSVMSGRYGESPSILTPEKTPKMSRYNQQQRSMSQNQTPQPMTSPHHQNESQNEDDDYDSQNYDIAESAEKIDHRTPADEILKKISSNSMEMINMIEIRKLRRTGEKIIEFAPKSLSSSGLIPNVHYAVMFNSYNQPKNFTAELVVDNINGEKIFKDLDSVNLKEIAPVIMPFNENNIKRGVVLINNLSFETSEDHCVGGEISAGTFFGDVPIIKILALYKEAKSKTEKEFSIFKILSSSSNNFSFFGVDEAYNMNLKRSIKPQKSRSEECLLDSYHSCALAIYSILTPKSFQIHGQSINIQNSIRTTLEKFHNDDEDLEYLRCLQRNFRSRQIHFARIKSVLEYHNLVDWHKISKAQSKLISSDKIQKGIFSLIDVLELMKAISFVHNACIIPIELVGIRELIRVHTIFTELNDRRFASMKWIIQSLINFLSVEPKTIYIQKGSIIVLYIIRWICRRLGKKNFNQVKSFLTTLCSQNRELRIISPYGSIPNWFFQKSDIEFIE